MDTSHRHDDSIVPAGEFKQRCLALLDEVAETGRSIVVTKRGRPVARIVPVGPHGAPIRGSVHVVTTDEEELFSTADAWQALPPT